MERLTILAPAICGVALFVMLLGVYTMLARSGRLGNLGPYKSNEILGPFWAGFIVWMLQPIERALIGAHVSPTHVTAVSLALALGSGAAVAVGRLALGAWLLVISGILDMLDGRLARAQNRESPAGALFDSVADRWGELGVFTGLTWYLRGDPWLLAVMLAAGGSFMVSYTRARAEGLGYDLRGGAMQRAERILLISVGTMVAASLDAAAETVDLAAPAIGVALTACGLLSCKTAIGRWIVAHRALEAAAPTPSTPRLAMKVGEIH